VDCLQNAGNIQVLKALANLKELNLGIQELGDMEILRSPNFRSLTALTVGDTGAATFDLESLQHLQNLERLRINGHTKNLESIAELSNLEHLSLNAIKKAPLAFVNHLRKLRTLSILLGSRDDLNEVKQMELNISTSPACVV
jgi:protein phosphatase 1 regulatory subunit 7